MPVVKGTDRTHPEIGYSAESLAPFLTIPKVLNLYLSTEKHEKGHVCWKRYNIVILQA